MPTPPSAASLLAELPRLRRYARILTDDPEQADRLVEETLARARELQNESLESTRNTQLLALLRSVNAHNAAANAPGGTPPGAGYAGAGPNAEPDARGRTEQAPADRGAEMLAQLRELPLEQREVLVLVAVERLSYVEIAALLRMPVATVISRLSQARAALRARSSKTLSAPNAS